MNSNNTKKLVTLVHSEDLLCEVLRKVSILESDESYTLTVLVALYKHIEKQKWVGGVVASILGADLDELGLIGAFAHPEHLSQEGDVPGLKDWKYYFHGQGCCLTHSDGTSIDVDFPDGRSNVIDPYFFGNYLQSIPNLNYLKSRLTKPEPFGNSWTVELPILKDKGWITKDHQFSLTIEGLVEAEKLIDLWDEVEGNQSLFAKAHASVLLGDFSLARLILRETNSLKAIGIIEKLAYEYEEKRFLELMQRAERKEGFDLKDIFRSAASLGDSFADRVVEQAFKKGKMDSMMLFIVELMDKLSPQKYSKQLELLISKAWRGKPPQPAIRIHSIKSLMSLYDQESLPIKLRKKFTKALCKRLDRMGDDAGRLLYLFDEKAGLKLLSKCVSSEVPIVRDGAVTTLAAIGTPEAIEILRNHGSVTTETMLAILNGSEIAKFIPLGSEVQIGDKTTRTFTFEELEDENREDNLKFYYEESRKEYRPLLERWKTD